MSPTGIIGVVNKRLIPLIAAFIPLSLAACGGGDETPKTAKEGDAFCKAAQEASDASDEVDFESGDADALKKAIDDSLSSGKAAADKAPADIADTVKTVNDGQEELAKVFEDNNYDITAVIADEKFIALTEDEEITDASDELDQYLDDKCGIASDSTDTTSPDDTTPTEETAATEETTAPDSSEGAGGSVGPIDAGTFIDAAAIDLGVELTDEQRQCFIDEVADVTPEQLGEAVGGTPSEEVQQAVGLAILKCEIPIEP